MIKYIEKPKDKAIAIKQGSEAQYIGRVNGSPSKPFSYLVLGLIVGAGVGVTTMNYTNTMVAKEPELIRALPTLTMANSDSQIFACDNYQRSIDNLLRARQAAQGLDAIRNTYRFMQVKDKIDAATNDAKHYSKTCFIN